MYYLIELYLINIKSDFKNVQLCKQTQMKSTDTTKCVMLKFKLKKDTKTKGHV